MHPEGEESPPPVDEVEQPGESDHALGKFVSLCGKAAMRQHIRTGDLMLAAPYEARDLALLRKQCGHLRRRLRKLLA